MNPIKFCRLVGNILADNHADSDTWRYDRHKDLESGNYEELLMGNSCLPDLLVNVMPFQVAEYIEKIIKEGRIESEKRRMEDENFRLEHYRRQAHVLLSNEGLYKLMQLEEEL